MNNTPNYRKWFNGSTVVPAAEVETTTVVKGQILASGLANHNQAPPTNGDGQLRY